MNKAKNPVVDEAKALCRPCLELYTRKRDGTPMGKWGGSGLVLSPRPRKKNFSWRHWLSINCSWLSKNGYNISGCLSVYEEMDDTELRVEQWGYEGMTCYGRETFDLLTKREQKKARQLSDDIRPAGSTGRFIARCNKKGRMPRKFSDGAALYWQERKSHPPLPAVCLYGGEPIQDWLKTLGMTRNDYDEPVLYKSEEAEQYESDVFFKHYPMYKKTLAAIVGGWQDCWPSDKQYDQGRGQLILWTFRDSEPWLEVWLSKSGRLSVIPRIT